MTAPGPDPLTRLRTALLAVEAAFAAALSEALDLIRDPDPEARKAALEALRLSPERMLAAVEAVEEERHLGDGGVEEGRP